MVMARAGFTAISSGKIRFGKDGRWYSDDEPIPNRAINRLFSRTLKVLPDGRARLELGEDRADVIIEDTPWVVTAVDGDPARGFTAVLNDETREPLDPGSLRAGADHVLYCRVKGGRFEARFLRPAYYELMRHVELGVGGEAVLAIAGRRVVIGSRRT
jgi:hypothetical protein